MVRKQSGGMVVVTDSPWGDSGKGRVTDQLTENKKYSFGVRFQGGANSGHSVVLNDQLIDVHALPSSLVRSAEREIMSVMGRGMVFSLPGIVKEMKHLRSLGIEVTPSNLLISEGAQLTLPYHRALEAAREDSDEQSGTTRQAISQTYGLAKMYAGIRVGDIRNIDHARERAILALGYTNAILTGYYLGQPITMDEVMDEIEKYRDKILPFLGNEIKYLNQMLQKGKWGIAEGAQSSMLGVDLGMYPHGTASNTWAGAIQHGCGIHYSWIKKHYLVIKAYDTRVGLGPLVSQMNGEIAELIQKRGHEFGVTSGRQRMIAYPDQVIARFVNMVGMPTDIVINKADVLTGLDPLSICVAYELDGKRVEHLPISVPDLWRCKPILEEHPGWKEDITGVTSWDDLPENAQKYHRTLMKPFPNSNLSMIGTGPNRGQMIIM